MSMICLVLDTRIAKKLLGCELPTVSMQSIHSTLANKQALRKCEKQLMYVYTIEQLYFVMTGTTTQG